MNHICREQTSEPLLILHYTALFLRKYISQTSSNMKWPWAVDLFKICSESSATRSRIKHKKMDGWKDGVKAIV